MSILDHNYDVNVSLNDLWDINVMAYKYGQPQLIENEIKRIFGDGTKWVKAVEESWDHCDLIEALEELISPQATNLSPLRSCQEVYTGSHFIIHISNVSGQVLKVKFTKKK